MTLGSTARKTLLFIGDVVALYAALFATLIIRYGKGFYSQFTGFHATPFTIIFACWILIFYIAGLYDLRRLRNNLDFLKILSLTLFVNAILAILFFYLIPTFGITPKTNLFLTTAIFACLELYWRRAFNRAIGTSEAPNKVLLVGDSKTAGSVRAYVAATPQLGYEIKAHISEDAAHAAPEAIEKNVRANGITLVVVPYEMKHDPTLTKVLYHLLGSGIEVRDLDNFYELVLGKVPLEEVEEIWFLENITEQHKFYDDLKRASEIIFALALAVILSPILLILAILVKLTSRGPVIFKQVRVGQNNRSFTLYKFRSMRANAEAAGAQWKASGTRDPRLTPIGSILVASHIDELLQLFNILKGEMSFVGPRPERPEFVKLLQEKIQHYNIRHLVKPGIAGWAQINYRYGASVEDAYEKLEYDIYYVKNRSIFIDVAIVLKTVKAFFVNQK